MFIYSLSRERYIVVHKHSSVPVIEVWLRAYKTGYIACCHIIALGHRPILGLYFWFYYCWTPFLSFETPIAMKLILLLIATLVAYSSAHMCLLYPHQRGNADNLNTGGISAAISTCMFVLSTCRCFCKIMVLVCN